MNKDLKYMTIALKEAKKALENDEVPVGAVIVIDNKIIAKAYNKKEKTKIATNHAEIIVINKACKKYGDWRLNNATIYVTLEPCAMCLGAIKEARIERLVFATKTANSLEAKEVIVEHISNEKLRKNSSTIIKDFFKNKRK